jgi:alcohol dehydrogenase YqhD (iron-dependent ADH family)
MHTFEYYNPVRIIFGAGEIKRAGQEAAALGKTALLVTYSDHHLFDQLISDLEADLNANGVKIFKYFGVSPNPKISEVAGGVEMCREKGVDLIVGLGGGSAMDAAKMIAAGMFYQGDLWDMVFSRHDESRLALPPVKALPIMMVPTLPATGSEMNPTAVVTHDKLKEKSYTWSHCLYPKVSIVDPELTVSLPPSQTACAAADTISHVLEFYLLGFEGAYLNNRIQEAVMLTVKEYMPFVMENPKDVNARAHLQWASIVALNGWSQPGDGWTPMHQLGHVLSAHTDCSHGTSLSIVMPAWMKHYYHTNLKQYAMLAQRVFADLPEEISLEEAARSGIDCFESLLKDWGMPTRLNEIGLSETDIPSLVADVVRVSFGPDGTMRSRPPTTFEDLEAIFKLAV